MDFVNPAFIYWATERDSIRRQRAAGVPKGQMTTDPILNQYRFCNVSREDDRMTVWIKDHIRDPWDDAGDVEELFRAVCIARFFNTDGALGNLIDTGVMTPGVKINLNEVAVAMAQYKAASKKNRVFNSAYLVGAPENYRTAQFGIDKAAYVCGVISTSFLPAVETREQFVKELNKQFGFKSFMSGQVAADLAYTRILQNAPDHMTWGPFGPGAIRGMNRSLGRPVGASMKEDEYLRVAKAQLAALPPEIVMGETGGSPLTLHDIASNVNCETDKYLRIHNQEDKHGDYVGKVSGMRKFIK